MYISRCLDVLLVYLLIFSSGVNLGPPLFNMVFISFRALSIFSLHAGWSEAVRNIHFNVLKSLKCLMLVVGISVATFFWASNVSMLLNL